MGVQVPIGFGQASMRWSLSGDPDVQVVTFGVDALDFLDPSNVPVRINTAAQSAGLVTAAGMQSGWAFLGTWVDWQTPTGFIRYEENLNVLGTQVAPGLPSNCALLVRKLTALGGRKNKGRFYFPSCYLFEANVDQRGVIAGTQLTALQTAFSNFHASLILNDVQPVLLHDGPEVPTNITQLAVQPTIATQRRRMR